MVMNDASLPKSVSEFQHQNVVEAQHRFQTIKFYDEIWDLQHLDAFALRLDPELGFEIDIVVLFTCHCFAHSMRWDKRAPTEIPSEEIFDNGIERRVLDKDRYELSRRFLPQLVKELDQRQIRFAGVDATNFFIAETSDRNLAHMRCFFRWLKTGKERSECFYTCSLLTGSTG